MEYGFVVDCGCGENMLNVLSLGVECDCIWYLREERYVAAE